METKATLNIGKNAEIKYDSVTVKTMYDSLSDSQKTDVQAHIIEKISPSKLWQLMLAEQVAKVIEMVDKEQGDIDTKPLKLTPEMAIANGFIENTKDEELYGNSDIRFFIIPKKQFLNRAVNWNLVYIVSRGVWRIEDDPTIEIYSVNQFKSLLRLMGLENIANDFKTK